jgi:hypothetical protein
MHCSGKLEECILKLLCKSATENFTSVSRSIEYMGDKFVLVTVSVDVPAPAKPYLFQGGVQWRLYGEAEPLTVSLDVRDDISPNDGILREIRFFISETVTQESNTFCSHEKLRGLPVFSFDRKETTDGFYHDEKGNFNFQLVDNTLYCLFDGFEVAAMVEVSNQLSCLLDNQRILAGLALQDLSDDEIDVLKEANLM